MLVSPRSSPASKALAWSLIGLGLLAVSCAPLGGDPPVDTKLAAVSAAGHAGPGNLDLLFVVDDSPEMMVMQKKLAAQIPTFIDALANLPGGLPNLHVAVISSDLGAPGDSTASIGCTTAGDQGLFQLGSPSCKTMLDAGATYLSNVGGSANYAGNLADLLTCMIPLGETGCGFGHQLGSLARALGADGSAAPAGNAGFLRPDAELAIVLLSHTDDCSAPPSTVLYSVNNNNGITGVANALGPLTDYRCNRWGHLCVDPTGDPTNWTQPPLIPPADAQGPSSAPTLNMTDCQSLESDSLLIPVSTFVDGIEALKTDPANQIVVGAIVAPPAPYTVAWLTHDGEIWPQIEHACGSGSNVNPTGQVTTDGSFGDPSVRISHWVQGFGDNGIATSICDASYGDWFGAIVTRIAAHLQLQIGGVNPTTSGSGGAVTTGGGGTTGSGGSSGGGGTTGSGGSSIGGGTTGDGGSSVGGPGGGGGVGSGGSREGSGGNNPISPPPNANEGLKAGGCDVAASTPGASTLAAVIALLALARGRRRASRGAGVDRGAAVRWRGESRMMTNFSSRRRLPGRARTGF